jgi:hypothetical protein
MPLHPESLSLIDLITVNLFTVVLYSGIILTLVSNLVSSCNSSNKNPFKPDSTLWDHPEPNFAILNSVTEFFASVTAMPIAGMMLLVTGLKYDYSKKVIFLYIWDCWMYSCAFFSHMTLWPTLNAITLSSVMGNSLYTFGHYSHLSGLSFLKPNWSRWTVTALIFAGVIYLVVVLPPWFGSHGGVPALLTIQTPAVLSALSGAWFVKTKLLKGSEDMAMIGQFLLSSGLILATAMAVSLIEVLYGQYCQDRWFGKFPLFHVIIHTLEQIGIYLYGVGVAGIEHIFLATGTIKGKINWIEQTVPYVAIQVDTNPILKGTSKKVTRTKSVKKTVRSASTTKKTQ